MNQDTTQNSMPSPQHLFTSPYLKKDTIARPWIPTVADYQPFECMKCVLTWYFNVLRLRISPTHIINVAHLS